MTLNLLLWLLIALISLGPAVGCAALAFIGMTPVHGDERLVWRITAGALTVSLSAALLSIIPLMLWNTHEPLEVVYISLLPGTGQDLHFGLFLDKLNAPFVIVIPLLSSLVGFFSRPYLHRDGSFFRFFILLLLFVVGMNLLVMGNALFALFIGWEIVGLSSALLISFYFTRREPIENALQAFLLYRFGDTALFVASAMLAETAYGEHFHGVTDISTGPTAAFPIDGWLGVAILVLIVCAAAIKSAQFPFSSWLPRAMEGPTPSSAIFYGGLAVHAGLYLLLRLSAEYIMPLWFHVLIASIGLVSALIGNTIGRMQTDIKSALAYASLAQVGVMFVELALGFHALVIVHFVGHSTFRLYQILSVGSLIHEKRPIPAHPDGHAMNTRSVRARLASIAFNLGADDRHILVRGAQALERLSRRFAAGEDWMLNTVDSRLTSGNLIGRYLRSISKNEERSAERLLRSGTEQGH